MDHISLDATIHQIILDQPIDVCYVGLSIYFPALELGVIVEKKIKHILKLIKLNENTLSMFFGIVTVILVGILAFRMYKTNAPAITKEAETVVASPSPTAMLGEVKLETKEDGTMVPVSMPETYKVEKGDHLWKIAEKVYGSGYNWVDIAKENGIKQASSIEVGQELKLPKVAVKMTEAQKAKVTATATAAKAIEGDSYVVEKGDNLWNISVRAYADGYKWVEVAKANNMKNANHLEVGQKLSLPR